MKKLIILLMVVLLLPSIMAAPPGQSSDTTNGLKLEAPIKPYQTQGETFDYHLHLYNESNGQYMDNGTAFCLFHLYGPDGGHIVRVNDTEFNGVDFEVEVDGGNFTEVGFYEVLWQCEKTDYEAGGFIEWGFEVTPNGLPATEGQAILYFGLLLILSFFFILFLFGSIAIPFRNTTNDEGKIISINDLKYFKIVSIVFAYLTAIFIAGIARGVSANFLQYDAASNFFYWVYVVLLSLAVPIVPVVFILMLIFLAQDRKIKDKLMRGIPG